MIGSLGEVKSLFQKLRPLVVRCGVEDTLKWKRRNGRFSVSLLYRLCSRTPSDPFSWSII